MHYEILGSVIKGDVIFGNLRTFGDLASNNGSEVLRFSCINTCLGVLAICKED